MARSANLTVGVIAVVAFGGFALYRYVLRPGPEKHDPSPAPVVPPSLSTTPSTEPVRTPDRVVQPPTPSPSLPVAIDAAPALTPADGFASETRDPAWAPQIEAEIAERLAKAPAKIRTECRTSRCQLTLDGPTDDVSKTLGALESTKGLIQFADSLYLTKPTERDDGTMQLHAIATFNR